MKKILNSLLLILLILFIFNITYYFYNKYSSIKTYTISSPVSYDDNPKYINEDIIGNISIPNLNIDLPLVQGLDNEFYLNHDYNKNNNKFGAIFLDYQSDLNRESTSIIYGHSSKIYTLPFNNLKKYLDESYRNANKYIYINYLGTNYTYKLVDAYSSSKLAKITKKGYFLALQTCNQEELNKFIYIIYEK